jgi:protein-ribulosamine 3-kinase
MRNPRMFEYEASGLEAIKSSEAIATPEVILYSEFNNYSFLILDWIETKMGTAESARLLGLQLAAMHRCTVQHFGFKHNNYMGSLPQLNTRHTTWTNFFIQQRLQPIVGIALNKKLLTAADADNFEKLYHRLPQLFNEEAPALLHGDLWSGNYLINIKDKPYLIDPAVSYGHREFDIAMTTLFGGYAKDFYQAYNEAFPLARGWQQRLDLWNLYPLLLHLNLFGKSYINRVKSALQHYL